MTDLNDHMKSHQSLSENSRYNGGNLFDDLQFHVNTMQLSEIENVAESTRLNCSPVTFEDMEETVKCVE